MLTVNDVLTKLWTLAPLQYRLPGDNVGLLCGRADAPVTGILVALDATLPVAEEAAQHGCELVVTHHPLIYGGLKAAADTSPTGSRVLAFAERGLSVICMHTNLDCAPGGVNDVLAECLGLHNVKILPDGETAGLIRTGEVAQQPLADFAAFVKAALGCPGLRYCDGGRPVARVAVGGGACGEYWEQVLAAGCDTLVTADLKYHQFCDAAASGLNLIDAGHFETENPVCDALLAFLAAQTTGVKLVHSAVHADCVRFL